MILTQKPCLHLANQSIILSLLNRESKNGYSELFTKLENGFEIFYSYVHNQKSENISQAKGRFVYDVLSIYRRIESYKRDNPAGNIAHCAWGRFPGFDKDHESEYRAFALFLIETQKEFAEQLEYKDRTNSFNTRAQTLDKYKRMVFEWKKLHKDLSTQENILRVLEA